MHFFVSLYIKTEALKVENGGKNEKVAYDTENVNFLIEPSF